MLSRTTFIGLLLLFAVIMLLTGSFIINLYHQMPPTLQSVVVQTQDDIVTHWCIGFLSILMGAACSVIAFLVWWGILKETGITISPSKKEEIAD